MEVDLNFHVLQPVKTILIVECNEYSCTGIDLKTINISAPLHINECVWDSFIPFVPFPSAVARYLGIQKLNCILMYNGAQSSERNRVFCQLTTNKQHTLFDQQILSYSSFRL